MNVGDAERGGGLGSEGGSIGRDTFLGGGDRGGASATEFSNEKLCLGRGLWVGASTAPKEMGALVVDRESILGRS